MANFNQDRDEIQLQDAMLANLRDKHRIIVARGTFPNLPAGVFTEQLLIWENAEVPIWACLLGYIQVVQTVGLAASFDSEIRKKAGGTGLNIAWQYVGGVGRIDITPNPTVPFRSEETIQANKFKLPFAIKPIGGIGSYDMIVYAHRSR